MMLQRLLEAVDTIVAFNASASDFACPKSPTLAYVVSCVTQNAVSCTL